jgi:elongation factor Ts
VAELALANDGAGEVVRASGYPGESRTVEEQLTHLIATIGENMSLRRMTALGVNQGHVASYVHNAVAEGLGKIAVLVALESEAPLHVLEPLGKQLAMHVAAAAPQALSVDDLDQAAVERERAVLIEQARESGKPMEIIEKMIEGRMRKFYKDVVLLEQTSVIDGETQIGKWLASEAKKAGKPIALAGFVRYALGEGIEKASTDFAAEVAAAVGA